MGLFDSVAVKCPVCGEPNWTKSRAADFPADNTYAFETAPDKIAVDVASGHEAEPLVCDCGATFRPVAIVTRRVELV
jgi:hypothetical protein